MAGSLRCSSNSRVNAACRPTSATAPSAGPRCTGSTPPVCSCSRLRRRPRDRGSTRSATRACRCGISPRRSVACSVSRSSRSRAATPRRTSGSSPRSVRSTSPHRASAPASCSIGSHGRPACSPISSEPAAGEMSREAGARAGERHGGGVRRVDQHRRGGGAAGGRPARAGLVLRRVGVGRLAAWAPARRTWRPIGEPSVNRRGPAREGWFSSSARGCRASLTVEEDLGQPPHGVDHERGRFLGPVARGDLGQVFVVERREVLGGADEALRDLPPFARCNRSSS